MTASYIQEIQALAAGFPERPVVLYFPDFESDPPQDNLNRVFGPPVGIDDESWPIYRGLDELLDGSDAETIGGDIRMEHVFTIDLKGIEAPWAPSGARAMLLFIASAMHNKAWKPENGQTEVIFLDEATALRGLYPGDLPRDSGEHDQRRFTLVEVRVPSDVFGEGIDEDSPLGQLRKAIWKAPARLGGTPIWLQGAEDDDDDDFDEDDYEDDDDYGDDDDGDDDQPHADVPDPKNVGLASTGDYCLQFDERFADINLGDSGVMYVFGDDAHYQSY